MLELVSLELLTERLLVEHPTWTTRGATEHAAQMIEQVDYRLSDAVLQYLDHGAESDFLAPGMSLLGIRALMGCTYLEAVSAMSVWLNNPAEARGMITRRGMAR